MEPQPLTKAVFSVEEFLASAGISRFTFYKEVKADRIKIVKCGRRTLIPATELNAWLGRLGAAV